MSGFAAGRKYWVLIFLYFLLFQMKGQVWADDAVRATLSNGLRVIIVRNAITPVATTMVNYLVGANECPAGYPGMAHAQEHMMFRGSPGLSADQLSTIIAALGGRFDADTQQTVTRYYLTVPREFLDVALKVEALRMQDILDSEASWMQERGAIEQEVAQDLSNPMYVFYNRLLAHLFDGTVYAHDALGTRPSFEKTTGAQLKAFYDTWYRPNNAILVIAGDVDAEETLAKVKHLFEGIPAKPLHEKSPIMLKPMKAAIIELETDLPYELAIVAYRLPGYSSRDFAASKVMADVLNSERADLYRLVIEGKALDAGFETSFLPEAGFGYAYAAVPQGEDGQLLISEMKGIVDNYLKNGIPAELTSASKNHEIADSAFRKNSIEGLAGEWSIAVAVEGRRSVKDDVEAIKNVTSSDVDRTAHKYLVNDTAVVGLLHPHVSGKAVHSHTFRGKESFAPHQTDAATLPPWAQKVMAPADIPRSNVSPEVSTLPNGLRLIVQRETISPTISIYGAVKNNSGMQTPKGREGVDEVLESLFPYGTETLDRLSFHKAVDDIAARISVGSRFSLQVLTDHFEKGVELLAANLLRPALPEKDFKIVRQETSRFTASLMKSPRYLSKRALLKALYPKGDPSLRQATPDSVSSLILSDVKNYHQSVFRPDLTVIVIIGDVTAERAREVIGTYFGSWKAVGQKPETDPPPVPLNGRSEATIPDESRVQDMVIMAETTGLTRYHPDYYTLQLGNHILSGAFYATRLYRDLREKAGLVYSVESILQADKTRSSFQIVYACDPQNSSKTSDLIIKNLKNLQTDAVTQKEIMQAKILLLRKIPLEESSYDGIGEGLLQLALMDLPMDESMRAAKRYLTITPAAVRAAFSKWIRPKDFVTVSLGPKSS